MFDHEQYVPVNDVNTRFVFPKFVPIPAACSITSYQQTIETTKITKHGSLEPNAAVDASDSNLMYF